MFLYLTLGTNDLARAKRFYDAALAPLGLALRTVDPDELGYGRLDAARTQLWITQPYDGNAANNGNGTMVALVVDSHAKVDALHARALSLGAKDEGPVGPRGEGFYAGYFRDLDGNKLNVFCMG